MHTILTILYTWNSDLITRKIIPGWPAQWNFQFGQISAIRKNTFTSLNFHFWLSSCSCMKLDLQCLVTTHGWYNHTTSAHSYASCVLHAHIIVCSLILIYARIILVLLVQRSAWSKFCIGYCDTNLCKESVRLCCSCMKLISIVTWRIQCYYSKLIQGSWGQTCLDISALT